MNEKANEKRCRIFLLFYFFFYFWFSQICSYIWVIFKNFCFDDDVLYVYLCIQLLYIYILEVEQKKSKISNMIHRGKHRKFHLYFFTSINSFFITQKKSSTRGKIRKNKKHIGKCLCFNNLTHTNTHAQQNHTQNEDKKTNNSWQNLCVYVHIHIVNGRLETLYIII